MAAQQRLPRGAPLKDRLLFRRQIDDTGCWIWTGAKSSAGYGQLRITPTPSHNYIAYAHRLAWEIFRAPIPAGIEVCHHCDVPACFNPDHLFVGTHQDNMRDMTAKGRRIPPRGMESGRAKLTDSEVVEIRRAVANGAKIRATARHYGVHHKVIMQIRDRRTWTHI